MANPEHLAKVKQSVASWNEWLAREGPPNPDLCEADLGGADLDGVNFYGADLSLANC